MSLARSPRLCASDDGEGCCHYRALLDTPVGDRHPGCLGHRTMPEAGGAATRSSHDDLA